MIVEETVKTVGGINFALLSPNDIRKYSVTEITAPETYDEDGMAVQGGLMDYRLGTIEPGQKCGTCGNTAVRCPGHFGHVELAEPVIHVAFVDDLHKLLVSICRSCGRIKLTPSELSDFKEKMENKTSFTPTLMTEMAKEIYVKAKKVKICPHCGKQQYEIEYTKSTIFHEVTEGGGATRLLPIAIRERLEKMIDDDLLLLSYDYKATRPEWFILQVLPVPPLAVRPSITLESGVRSEDDLTHKIVDILRVNQRVKESKESGTPPLIVQDLVDLLQYHVTTFFDNEVSGIPQAHHRSGRPLKTISQRLKGKEGRFRGSLSGKRVDFSSRTVISPDPSLDISEVGIPFEVAKKLTIPEKVSPWNIDFLKKLVMTGPDGHPGANYVIRPDGVKIRLDYVMDREIIRDTLALGYIVERHLVDKDIAIFNRQPSLHRMSVMAHFIRVLPCRTFRLHPAVCPPYNADFDGDEMNLHIPQSEEARSEAAMLMKVHDQLISPRYGGPIIGAIREFLTAAYLLTNGKSPLTREDFTKLAYAGGYSGPLPSPANSKKSLYDGKQLFSLFLPKDFNYVMASKWSRGLKGTVKNDVVIKNGQLLSGVIDRAAIGAEEPDSILHRIAIDYGTDEARKFLNSICSLLKEYLSFCGFTYGYNELTLAGTAKEDIERLLDDTYGEVRGLISQYNKKTLQLTRGLSPEEALEFYTIRALAKARDGAGKVADTTFPLDNSGVVMARTGARGSSLNIGQMTAALGQQSVRGRRIHNGYQSRALPHFQPGDQSPDASGFVKSNYREGLDPIEFFFHAMGGREGLVDTAVRTQQSGYMQRRLVNALEHIKVEYDLTARDPHGNIMEFTYGEDGVDPAKSDHGRAVNVERLIETEALTFKKGKSSEKEILSILGKYKRNLNPRIVDDLLDCLKSNPISGEHFNSVCKKAVELLKGATVEPGEASGIVAAQSIGEPGTQMTLRTFHFAGVAERDVTLGLPRLIELVDARKIPSKPSMEVYLDKESRSSNEKALKVARNILFTKASDLLDSCTIDYTGKVKLVLNDSLLKDRDCDIDMVAEGVAGAKKKVEVSRDRKSVTVSVDNANIQSLFVLRNKLLNTKVKGIPGITRVTVVKPKDEWLIHTSGSSLAKVFKVEGVDTTRTTTNNIHEINTTLGIEAARTALVKELMGTLEEQGLEVDIRHIYLVSDLMTSKGFLQSIGRHGIAGTKSSVLARAAFEITVPTIAAAAVKGEHEGLKGVTENVIVGLPIPLGTGMIDVFMRGK